MFRWMVEFEIESHVCVEQGSGSLKYEDPAKQYSVEIRNSPNLEKTSFLTSVIFESLLDDDSGNEKKIRDKASVYLKEFLSTLSLVTKSKLEVKACLRIVDWRIGIKNRKVHQFKNFPNPDIPFDVISPEHIRSVQFLASRHRYKKVENAVRWFSKGINADYYDEQFQCFWFALEILASHIKPKKKVHDRCVKCSEPLFCKKCNEAPTHRPFNKQAIEILLRTKKYGNPDEITIQQLFEIRNRLMHGDFIEEIESELKISMKNMIDHLGNFIWSWLISTFKFPQAQNESLLLMQPNTFSNYHLTAHVFAKIEAGDPLNPDPRNFTGVQIDMKTVVR